MDRCSLQLSEDNTAVQNIVAIEKDDNTEGKQGFQKNRTGFSPQQWAQILKVKKPMADPNAMDTSANRGHMQKGFKTHAAATEDTLQKP